MTLNRDTASQNHINFYYFFIYIYTEYCSFIIPNTPARNNTQKFTQIQQHWCGALHEPYAVFQRRVYNVDTWKHRGVQPQN